MWQSYFNGILVVVGLIIVIGVQNVFVFVQSLCCEYYFLVVVFCVFCDVVLVSFGVFGLVKLLLENLMLLVIVCWGGIVFLIWYGFKVLFCVLCLDVFGNVVEIGLCLCKVVFLVVLVVILFNFYVYFDIVFLIGLFGVQQVVLGVYVFGVVSVLLMWFFVFVFGVVWLVFWLVCLVIWCLFDLMVVVMMLGMVV